LSSLVIYATAAGAGENLNVYARPDGTSPWTYVGQVTESVSVDWLGTVGYPLTLSGSGLSTVAQVMLVGQDAAGSSPGFDLMAVSGLTMH
jgi:hypothetical protein